MRKTYYYCSEFLADKQGFVGSHLWCGVEQKPHGALYHAVMTGGEQGEAVRGVAPLCM